MGWKYIICWCAKAYSLTRAVKKAQSRRHTGIRCANRDLRVMPWIWSLNDILGTFWFFWLKASFSEKSKVENKYVKNAQEFGQQNFLEVIWDGSLPVGKFHFSYPREQSVFFLTFPREAGSKWDGLWAKIKLSSKAPCKSKHTWRAPQEAECPPCLLTCPRWSSDVRHWREIPVYCYPGHGIQRRATHLHGTWWSGSPGQQ